jgi:hypothetical protein
MAGFTITGGVSFSGAVSMSDAPPPTENTAAWFGSGFGTASGIFAVESTVYRITFATDTATASVRGPLSLARNSLAAASNFTDGWFGGGGGGSTGVGVSTVDRITYATDTATASVRGPLSLARRQLAAAGNETYGWFGGGYTQNPEGPPYYFIYSTVDRITYATDTATASVRGPLSTGRYSLAAAGNTTDGWFGGGGSTSTVNRITYATDTATASVRGPLSSARYFLAATGNFTDGWFGGGNPGPLSSVNRITYATDTATASVRGPLSAARYNLAAAGNTTDGYFGGGGPGVGVSTVQRITYATDTATASVRGPLGGGKSAEAAAGGVQ